MKKPISATLLLLSLTLIACSSVNAMDEAALEKKIAAASSSKELLKTFFGCVRDAVQQYTLEMEVPEENLGNVAWSSCSEDYYAYEILQSAEAGKEIKDAEMDLVNCKGKYYTNYQVVELLQKDLARAFEIMKKNMQGGQ